MKTAFLPHRGVIKISGPDGRAFLQGLITNDALKLEHAMYACLLTPQGKFLYDFFLYAVGDDILLECEREAVPSLLKKLSLYRLRSKVTLEDISDVTNVYASWEGGDLRGIPDPRLPVLGARLLISDEQTTTATEDDYITLCYTHGVPYHSRDLIADKSIPLESGLDELHAIAWDKGCYMGQELTARTKYRGLVRKRLFPVTIEGAPPEAGSEITWEGQKVGEIRAACGTRALALLRLEETEAPRSQGAPLVCGEAKLTVHTPEWMVF